MPQKYSPLLEKALRLSSNIGGEEQWHYIPELAVSQEQEEALRDAVQKQCPGGQNPLVIPVEWVVDVADESDTWFIATAYSFNDSTSTLHVMVPDCDNPDWEGDIPINPRVLHLLECCDSHSGALFKSLIMEGGMPVTWEVECPALGDGSLLDSPQRSTNQQKRSRGRAQLWLPLGCYIVFVPDDHESSTPRLVSADASLCLRICLDVEQASRKAFAQLSKEGLVSSTHITAHESAWANNEMSTADFLGLDTISSVKEVASRVRAVLMRTLNVRDTVLYEHMRTLECVRRLILDGDLDQGEKLFENIQDDRIGMTERWCTQEHDDIGLSTRLLEDMLEEVVYISGTRGSRVLPESDREEKMPGNDEAALTMRALELELQQCMETHRTLRDHIGQMEISFEANSPPRGERSSLKGETDSFDHGETDTEKNMKRGWGVIRRAVHKGHNSQDCAARAANTPSRSSIGDSERRGGVMGRLRGWA